LDAQAKNAKTAAVKGTANIQKIKKFGWTTGLASHFKEGRAKTVARNVAGRNAMVVMAITFMEALSFFIDCVSEMVDDASHLAMRLNIYIKS
jgi:hypothetical protein